MQQHWRGGCGERTAHIVLTKLYDLYKINTHNGERRHDIFALDRTLRISMAKVRYLLSIPIPAKVVVPGMPSRPGPRHVDYASIPGIVDGAAKEYRVAHLMPSLFNSNEQAAKDGKEMSYEHVLDCVKPSLAPTIDFNWYVIVSKMEQYREIQSGMK